jgi:hypothetical protein
MRENLINVSFRSTIRAIFVMTIGTATSLVLANVQAVAQESTPVPAAVVEQVPLSVTPPPPEEPPAGTTRPTDKSRSTSSSSDRGR